MIIKVLGPGCKNCARLERATRNAMEELGLEATVEKVTDYPTIAAYGVMSTPALVVDEVVVVPPPGGQTSTCETACPPCGPATYPAAWKPTL